MRLTRWLDRLAHFTINVNHIAGKHLAFTDYLSRNPTALPQTDDAYGEEYVINNILPHYKFISKHGCLSNQSDQSEGRTDETEHKTNNKLRSRETREQTAIDCLNNTALTRTSNSSNPKLKSNSKITMDSRTIDHNAAADSSGETTELIQRWKDIVKPGIYRLTGEKWKEYHEPKFLRHKRKVIEERVQQIRWGREQGDLRQKIGPQQSGGFQTQTRRSEQLTVDPFWEIDRPTPAQQQKQNPTGPSASTNIDHQLAPVLMEEGEIDTETDQNLDTWNWARYVGVKSVVQYVKMGHAPRIAAHEEKNWDLEQAVLETEKNFSTDLQLLMTKTTNDSILLKTLVRLERQQHELIPEEYQTHRKKLSSRFGLFFIEDKIIVPKNHRATVISLLHKRPSRHQQNDPHRTILLVDTDD